MVDMVRRNDEGPPVALAPSATRAVPRLSRTLVWTGAALGLAMVVASCGVVPDPGGTEPVAVDDTLGSEAADPVDLTAGDLDPSTDGDQSEAREVGDGVGREVGSEVGATADALRRHVADTDPGDDVRAFIDQASDGELDALAATACGLVEPDMTRTELGAASIEARLQLDPDDQELLDLTEFGAVFGAAIGLSCPDRLPVSVEPPPGPRDQITIDGYRELVPTLWGPEVPARRFVATVSDDRLHLLQVSACRFSDPDHSTTETGTAVLAHHRSELTAEERTQISLDDYAEVFGSLVGWFCPDLVPNID